MFDELQRLRDCKELRQLLSHYGASLEREAWVDRLMQLEGVGARELVQLHGELMAHGWLEQNTGVVSRAQANGCPGCYRATSAGRRALAQRGQTDEDEPWADAA